MQTPKIPVPGKGTTTPNAFSRYSLLGTAIHLESWLINRTSILASLCLLGEAAVIYARYNTGKTLITFYLILDDVFKKRINGCDVIYVNADDSAYGNVEKLKLTDEHGIHVVVPGHKGFSMHDLIPTIKEMIDTDTAKGKVIIVDTLKRAVDLMDKKRARAFTEVIRAFTAVGGTFVALAHTNKNTGTDGKPVPEGTGDVLNDFDTGHLLDCIGEMKDTGHRLVEFRCVKSRGQVTQRACYSYDANPALSYVDRLLSIQEVDPEEAEFAASSSDSTDNETLLYSIEMAIKHGSGTKMDTVRSVAQATGESHRSVRLALEQLTGDDPTVHRWNFKRGEHGRMKYFLLSPPAADGPQAD